MVNGANMAVGLHILKQLLVYQHKFFKYGNNADELKAIRTRSICLYIARIFPINIKMLSVVR